MRNQTVYLTFLNEVRWNGQIFGRGIKVNLYKILSKIGILICAIGIGLFTITEGEQTIIYIAIVFLALGLGINTAAGITKIYAIKKDG